MSSEPGSNLGAGPVKVLHILQSLGYGGMENRIGRLARGLDPQAFRVDVLTLRPGAPGSEAMAEGLRHTYFPIASGLHPMAIWKLARHIRRGGYRIVHTHNWSSMFYGVLAGLLAFRPLIIHGEHGLNRADLAGIPWKRLWAQRILARLCHALVPVNSVIAAHMREHWKLPAERLDVINNGVDLERFRVATPPAGFVLGMVGRLDDVKDIGTALGAMALLRARPANRDIKLVLVGDGRLAATLKAEAEKMGVAGAVEFAGGHKDVENWYPRFHVYMNTSVYEGMSNTLLEGMACGLPLIVSRVPGNASWLTEKENALFFEPRDAQGLADRIRELREHAELRAAMGKRNRERVERDFDNKRFLEIYAGFYRRLLGVGKV